MMRVAGSRTTARRTPRRHADHPDAPGYGMPTADAGRMTRHYLFLQGVASPFFARLGDHLSTTGARVSKINFCAGDAWYWGRRPAWRFRRTVDCLDEYLRDRFAVHDFTDLVLFGSRRPVHLPAIELADAHDVRVHVFEEGYVRPNWLTLERGGVNADSALPRDPAWYLEVDATLPRHADGKPAHSDIRVRAAHDMAYHLANGFNPLLYRGYRTHRPHRAPVEYAGWARRFARLPLRRSANEHRIRELGADRRPFYVLPLQLNADTQITVNSQYGGMPELIDTVLRSFARDAPAGSRLVIKNHPLDTGLIDYAGLISALERDLDLAGRVVYLETGALPRLLQHTAGVVTVNSTVGLIALAHRCPTLTLGTAIYDLPGLTFQGRLADFWDNAAPPDQRLFQAFRNTVIHTTQINGDLYTPGGIRMAVSNCDRLLTPRSPLQELIERFPPGRQAPRAAETGR